MTCCNYTVPVPAWSSSPIPLVCCMWFFIGTVPYCQNLFDYIRVQPIVAHLPSQRRNFITSVVLNCPLLASRCYTTFLFDPVNLHVFTHDHSSRMSSIRKCFRGADKKYIKFIYIWISEYQSKYFEIYIYTSLFTFPITNYGTNLYKIDGP